MSAIYVNRPLYLQKPALMPKSMTTICGGYRRFCTTIEGTENYFHIFLFFCKKAFDRVGLPTYTRCSLDEGSSVTPSAIRDRISRLRACLAPCLMDSILILTEVKVTKLFGPVGLIARGFLLRLRAKREIWRQLFDIVDIERETWTAVSWRVDRLWLRSRQYRRQDMQSYF